jgi:predicted CxxxxCH...CXXCH cytochrome family protein
MILSGCGEANTNAPSLNSTQKHPDNWLTGHRAAYSANSIQCRVCHGIDLKGGITKIDCFNQAGLGQCHAGGHGPRLANHLLPFADPTIHGPVARTDLIFCQGCHGTTGGAGSNPRFTVFYGSIPVGCETSGCHLAKTAHPKPWKNHPLAGNQANACSLCHGATFGGGNGPACKNCHAMLVAGQPPISGQCISCHGNPPAGTAIPDIAGSHAAHAALPELGHNCNACHNGGGADSAIHTSFSNHTVARVSFLPAFNAKSGSAAFAINSKSCANVKCHGGQATPAWGATLDSTTECLKCHTAGASQYNGYISGKHNFHLNLGLFCTDCHDMTRQTAPNHFSNLSSAVFNQPAANTIRSYINYNRALQPPTCFITSAPPPGTQFTACHSSLRSWLP